jgi:hypothetical protein
MSYTTAAQLRVVLGTSLHDIDVEVFLRAVRARCCRRRRPFGHRFLQWRRTVRGERELVTK